MKLYTLLLTTETYLHLLEHITPLVESKRKMAFYRAHGGADSLHSVERVYAVSRLPVTPARAARRDAPR